ncbi:MAG: hypothetical protein ACFFC6_09020 [Promethearchaeota archaeon]
MILKRVDNWRLKRKVETTDIRKPKSKKPEEKFLAQTQEEK